LSSACPQVSNSQTMKALRFPILPVAAVAALCMTCNLSAGPIVTSAQQTGYLQDYHRLGHVGGVPLEQVWINPEFDIRDYRTLYIPVPRIDPQAYYLRGEKDRKSAVVLANQLHAQLIKDLQGAGIFKFVTSDPYFSLGRHGALTLETRITEIDSGNPERRYKIGFGYGATQIQIEGKIIENRTCRTLSEFADRRVNPGDALWYGRRNSASGTYLMSLDTAGVMRGIVKLFIYLREEGTQVNQR
jgi:hypothetical protein